MRRDAGKDTDSEHTVYEGEIVGLTLALHLLTKLGSQFHAPIIVGTDSQAVIKALNNQRPHPAHYLLDEVHNAAEKLHARQHKLRNAAAYKEARHNGETWSDRTRNVIDLQIHWTPGHVGFEPNERADEIAKQAAQGVSSDSKLLPVYLRKHPLPQSIPALRQEHLAHLRKQWKSRWKKSPRFPRLNAIDKSLPSKKFLKLVDNLDRRQSAIIAQLRTGHTPLNQHLFRIRRSETPSCPHCQDITVETVEHFLFICPHYQHERHIIRRKLRRKAESLPYLLSSPEAVKPLIRYIHATKRFQTQYKSARHPPPAAHV